MLFNNNVKLCVYLSYTMLGTFPLFTMHLKYTCHLSFCSGIWNVLNIGTLFFFLVSRMLLTVKYEMSKHNCNLPSELLLSLDLFQGFLAYSQRGVRWFYKPSLTYVFFRTLEWSKESCSFLGQSNAQGRSKCVH